MSDRLRKSGIEILGDIPWGTHLCQFYRSKEDLKGILVPYFKAGLESNEFCMWVTSDPLGTEEAIEAMRGAVPGFDQYLSRGQIEIIPYTKWYLKEGRLDLQMVLNGWVEKLNQALSKGYEGVRVTGNTFWLEKRNWDDFADYEHEVNSVIGRYRMIAICTYSLERCGASEVMDVVSNHQFALIKHNGRWERIETSEHQLAKEILLAAKKELEAKITERTAELLEANEMLQKEISERKRVTEELREKSRILDAFFKHTITPLVVLDRNFNFIMVNNAYARAGQREVSEFPGLNHFELYPHEENERIFRSVVETKKPYVAVSKPFVYPDHPEWGVTYWDWTLVPVLDHRGDVEFLVFSLKDVTMRKRAELALKESEERFRSLVETTSDWVWEVDENAVYTYVSPRVRDLLGYEPEEVLGRTPFDLMPPDEAKKIAAIFGPIAASKEPFALLENVNMHKDGRLVVLETSGVPILDNNGRLLGYRGMDRDITGKKRALEAVRKSEASLANAQRIAGIGSWDWNLSTNEVCWSDEVCNIFGIPKEASGIAFDRFMSLAHPEDLEFIEKSVRECLDSRSRFSINYRILRPDRTVRTVHSEGEVILDDGGVPVRVSGVVQDVTERTRMEEELRKYRERLEELVEERTSELKTVNARLKQEILERKRAEKEVVKLNEELKRNLRELEDANRELEAFSYTLAHDLGAPLRVIDGYSYILLKESSERLDEEGKKFLNTIRSNTQKMKQLIDDLLDLARLGRQEIRYSEIDMNSLARSVFQEIRCSLPERSIRFDLKALPGARAERTMMRQVLVNLLSNSVKFTRPRPLAMIEAGGWTDGKENIYYIKDNGVGFDMRHSDKLFGVFRRLHTEKEFEGTGAGLSIVQRIIHRHGGRVWAEGELNRGATFYFTLPAADSAERLRG